MNTILILTRLTFREAVRRKIVLAALILGAAFLILFGVGIYYMRYEFTHPHLANSVTTPVRMQQQAFNFFLLAGLYAVNFLGIATAALISSDSLAGEIQSGTIQAIATKPIRRRDVVLGKWLGHALLLLLYVLMMGGGVILLVWLLTGYPAPHWPTGLVMIFFNSVTIMTLTLAFSSSISTLATGGAVFGAYGVAFLGGWIERIGSLLHSQTAINLGIISSLLLPTEAIWNKGASEMTSPLANLTGMSPFSSASMPSPLMLLYAGIYVLVILWLATRQFSRRDL